MKKAKGLETRHSNSWKVDKREEDFTVSANSSTISLCFQINVNYLFTHIKKKKEKKYWSLKKKYFKTIKQNSIMPSTIAVYKGKK